MKSEVAYLKTLLEMFEDDYKIACSILNGGQPDLINVNFYTRQKEWCHKYIFKFREMYNFVLNEHVEDRVIRCLDKTQDFALMDSVIQFLIEYKNQVKKEQIEALRKENILLEQEIMAHKFKEADKKEKENKLKRALN